MTGNESTYCMYLGLHVVVSGSDGCARSRGIKHSKLALSSSSVMLCWILLSD